MSVVTTAENENIEQKTNSNIEIINDEMGYNIKAEHEARPIERKDFGMTTISLIGSSGATLSAVYYFFAMPLALSMIMLPIVLIWLGFSLHRTLRSMLRI